MERTLSCPKLVTGAIALFMLVPNVITVTGAVPGSPAALADEPVAPIPLELDLNTEKIALGERLFHERALSRDGSTSCADCHRLDQGGDDGLAKPAGERQAINTPTVFNCRFNFRLSWLGTYRSLDNYIEVKLASSFLGSPDGTQVSLRLSAQGNYNSAFTRIYHNGITRKNTSDALTEFVRSLVTPNARFDRYLRGDNEALTTEEKQGYQAFKRYGCAACHHGINIGGNMFQKMGIFGHYFEGRKTTEFDLGRFTVTGDERDRHVFRVPSLRNITLTAPYFHDGSIGNLYDAVRIMAYTELGRDIPEQDIQHIVKFLNSLTGTYRGALLTEKQRDVP